MNAFFQKETNIQLIIVISIYNNAYGEAKLTAINDDAEHLQTLLKEKFWF